VTEYLAHIRNDQQFVQDTVLTKGSVTHGLTPMFAGKSHLNNLRTAGTQEELKLQRFSRESEHTRRNSAHKLLTGAIYDAQLLLLIESEDGNVNLHQNFFQQGGGL